MDVTSPKARRAWTGAEALTMWVGGETGGNGGVSIALGVRIGEWASSDVREWPRPTGGPSVVLVRSMQAVEAHGGVRGENLLGREGGSLAEDGED